MSTILLIDDDDFGRTIFARALADKHIVLHADSSEVACDLMADEAIDLVVVDAQLENGKPLAQVLNRIPATPILVLTSVFRDQTIESGGSHVETLTKPISPRELEIRIDRALGLPTGLDDPSAVMVDARKSQAEVAESIELALKNLEDQVKSQSVTQAEMSVESVRELGQLARRHGLARVAQALARMEQSLLKLEQRRGQINRELWAELNDGIDDAMLGVHFVLSHQRGIPTRDSTTRQQARVVVFDHDYESVRQILDYGRRHMIEVVHVSTQKEFDAHASRDDIDGIFVDVDVSESRDTTFEMARTLGIETPLALFATNVDLSLRVKASQVGAERFLEKPVELTEFADAVRSMVAMRQGAPSRILIVDDTPEFRAEVKTVMDGVGYETLHITESTEVLEQLDRMSPDALVISAEMPEVGGVDMCRVLRAIPRWRDLPIVVTSDGRDPGVRERAFHAEADDVLTRPIDVDDLAARLGVRVERYRRERGRSDYDLLTGLFTRRAFLERVAPRLSEARRRGRPVCVALIDLDRFKRVNDTYGHMAGDRVLNEVGRMLRRQFRLEDLRCRWGGEEFAVALIDETVNSAFGAMQRALEDFSAVEFRSDEGVPFQVTFSAGLAQYPDDGDQFETVLTCADERLFEAKMAGRNRIIY